MRRLILTVFAIALAFAGGYGYGRWYGPAPGAAAAKPARRILYYVDPMHPAYKSDKPGIAPDCGMKLEPVYEDGAGHPGAEHPTAEAAPPGAIHISPEKQQMIGVRYGEVEATAGSQSFRTTGKVAMDETRIARVHARLEGWIDEVFADFTGKQVAKGQRLLTLYSPEMFATQQEYLLALKSKEIMQTSTLHSARENSDSLLEAARRRLELWDLSAPQIEEIARTRRPIRNTTLYSPAGGYVIARNAYPKQRIMPETELYAIADLTRVWILADVFESDAPRVQVGQGAVVSLPYAGRQFHATVSNILPQADAQTRTLKVRLEADNPGLYLKPEMFADVEFRVPMARRLTVPSEAVLDTGLRKTVFVDRGNGYLEPRQVETGERVGDRVEIRKGLKAGERVVVSGNFLIDSESQL
ncbi:MAG: efflux RND transporter periplasmic adaptor subunit, partial [Acidobacteria bacterium]|nr:efflux RND transporter periplasmic adaptor subunit [Acidobacteriota bacterium]